MSDTASTFSSIVPWLAFGFNLLVQVVAFVWLLARMHSKIENVNKDVEPLSKLPERVSRLEWQTENQTATLGEIKDQQHKTNNKLQEIVIQLERIGAVRENALHPKNPKST